jgi:hypothetical protein
LTPAQGAQASGNGRYTIPCDSDIALSLTFGGKEFTLPSREAVSKEGDTCYGTVEVNDDGFYRVGSPFMRNVYT